MRLFAAMLFALLVALPARAQWENEVDLELLLMVDVSRSMSPGEMELQRRGYAEALRDPEVVSAITGGMIGKVALAYVEWAGAYSQRVIVDWTMLGSAADAAAVADRLTSEFSYSLRRTSISGALAWGAAAFEENAAIGLRRVIDISGDGPNNEGAPVTAGRDLALASGVTINGLPLMTREGMGANWHLDDLDAYYRACVIGGPGAFVLPVLSWEEFGAAVKRKLILEIAGETPPRLWRAQYADAPAYDCLIGEKMWQSRQRMWGAP